MIAKEKFDDLANIYLGSSQDKLAAFAKTRVIDMVNFFNYMNSKQQVVQIDPVFAMLAALSIAKTAIMADGVLTVEERVFVDRVFSDLEDELPGLMNREAIQAYLEEDAPPSDEEICAIYQLCGTNVRMCSDIIALIMCVLAVDGRITQSEQFFIEDFLPKITEGYEFVDILKEMKV